MLFQYMQRTQLLLNDPSFARFNDTDLINYINMARGQIAGEAECIRVYATLAITAASQQYLFTSINTGNSVTTGIQGALHVRQISYAVASGQKILHSRPFPWFNTFVLSQPVPDAGPPSSWSQFGQGAAGSIFFNLLDGPYTATLDVVGYPNALADDAAVEALPYQWTDAIPFFAAYYASMTEGDEKRAEAMWKEWEKFVRRARGQATSEVLPENFAQSPDPFMGNRLGLPQGRQ